MILNVDEPIQTFCFVSTHSDLLLFSPQKLSLCVCYGSIAAAFAVLLIANGRESVGVVRESASNLRGLCVRGSLWPVVNIMDSAM